MGLPVVDINSDKVAKIVRSTDGNKVVGRTRLQKIAYLLHATGLECDFRFAYKHYGPYSEDLACVAEVEILFDKLKEEKCRAQWGGAYSIYTVPEGNEPSKSEGIDPVFREVVNLANDVNPTVLELAATAVFLSKDGFESSWDETQQRKPTKSTDDNIQLAKEFLGKLNSVTSLPTALPENVL